MIQSQLLAGQDTVEKKILFTTEKDILIQTSLAHSFTYSLTNPLEMGQLMLRKQCLKQHPPVFYSYGSAHPVLLCARLLEALAPAPSWPLASLPPSDHCKSSQLPHTNEQARTFHSHPVGLNFLISPLSVKSLPYIQLRTCDHAAPHVFMCGTAGNSERPEVTVCPLSWSGAESMVMGL